MRGYPGGGPLPGGGELPYKSDGDARQIFLSDP